MAVLERYSLAVNEIPTYVMGHKIKAAREGTMPDIFFWTQANGSLHNQVPPRARSMTPGHAQVGSLL